jgi:hypothetical protein
MGILGGNIQVNFINLNQQRSIWTNKAYLNSLSTTRKIATYTSMFLLMYDLGFNLDTLFRDLTVQTMVKAVVNRFDTAFALQMRLNVLDNIQTLFMLARTSPGADCRSLGVRAGSTLRKVMQVSFD